MAAQAHVGCIFCGIAQGNINAEIILKNEDVVAFRDIHPAAPSHVLVIPRMHLESINDLRPENSHIMGAIGLAAKEVAQNLSVERTGYRLVFNTGKLAGQTVFHLHAHVLAGREFSWPPG